MKKIQLNNAHELCEYILRALDNSAYFEDANIPRFAGTIGMLAQNTEGNPSILDGKLFSEIPSIKSLIQITPHQKENPHHTSKRAVLMATFTYVKMREIVETQGNSHDTAEMLCEVLTLVNTASYAQCVSGVIDDTLANRAFIDKVFFQLCEWQYFHIAAEVLYAYKKLI